MADKQPVKKVRRVKDPETFIEKVVKAAEEGDKPTKKKRLSGTAKKVASPVTRPIAKAGKKVGKSKIAKPFRKPFRILGRILLPKYIRNSWYELKLVTWPSWKESRKLTFAVLVFALVFGVIVAIVDYGLDKVFKQLIVN